MTQTIATASALAVLTVFMAVALLTVGSSQPAPAPHVAAIASVQSNG